MDHKHLIVCIKYITIKQNQQNLNIAFYLLKGFETIHLPLVSTLVLNMMTSQLINTCHYRSCTVLHCTHFCIMCGKGDWRSGNQLYSIWQLLCYCHSYPLQVSSMGPSCRLQPSGNNHTPHKIARRLHFPPDTISLHTTLTSSDLHVAEKLPAHKNQ